MPKHPFVTRSTRQLPAKKFYTKRTICQVVDAFRISDIVVAGGGQGLDNPLYKGMTTQDKTLTSENRAFSSWNPIGDIIPHSWANHIGTWQTRANKPGKKMWRSRHQAQWLLAKIIFLYTPSPVYEDEDGQVHTQPVDHTRKFIGPYWQMNFTVTARDLGCSIRTVKSDLKCLIELGLVRTQQVPGDHRGSKSPPIYVIPVKEEIDKITYRITKENRNERGQGGPKVKRNKPAPPVLSQAAAPAPAPTPTPEPVVVPVVGPEPTPEEAVVSEELALAIPPVPPAPDTEFGLKVGSSLVGWGVLTVAKEPEGLDPAWPKTLWVNIPCKRLPSIEADLTPEGALVRPFAMIIHRKAPPSTFHQPYDNSSEASREAYKMLAMGDSQRHLVRPFMIKLEERIAEDPNLDAKNLAALVASPYEGVRDPIELSMRLKERRFVTGGECNELQTEILNAKGISDDERALWMQFAKHFPKAVFDSVGKWRGKGGENTERYKGYFKAGQDREMILQEAARYLEENPRMGYPLHPSAAGYPIRQAAIRLDK